MSVGCDGTGDEAARLEGRRDQVLACLGRAERYLQEAPDPAQAASRLERVHQLWGQFSELQASLDLLPQRQDSQSHWEHFEARYHRVVGGLQALVAPVSPAAAAGPPCGPAVFSVRLPEVELPVFGGEYPDWLPFREAFLSLVHDNPGLSEVQRLHYLRSCLRGPPLDLVHTLPITKDNYTLAWSSLNDRYHNMHLITQAHVKALLGMPRVRSRHARALRPVVSEAWRHVRALAAAGADLERAAFLLVPLIVSKLEAKTARRWELAHHDLQPSLQQLEQFLLRECSAGHQPPSAVPLSAHSHPRL